MSSTARAGSAGEVSAAAALTPRLWRLEEEPPGAQEVLLARRDDVETPPLLLLIDRREPLHPSFRERLGASLASDERRRHDTYRRPEDRQRFLLGRGGLRRLLGGWLQLAPQAVPLAVGPHGKPHCPIAPPFNVSHSGDLILIALHRERPVGVDVERLRPDLDWQAVAARTLGDRTLQAITGLPAAQRPAAFLAAWCRLEARLKARGTGLAGLEQLHRQDGLTGGEPGGRAAPGGERVWEVQVPPDYRAAVALAPREPPPGSARAITAAAPGG